MVMATLCAALLAVNLSTERSRVEGRTSQRSFYAAEAGLNEGYVMLSEELIQPKPQQPFNLLNTVGKQQLGASEYWFEVTTQGLRDYSIVSTGSDGAKETRLELVVSRAATGFFQFAAFGAEGVVLDSNAFIDSYDSAYGPYASQIQGGNAFALENGDIGSNQDILLKANTEIHGDAQPGPGHIVDDTAPNTFVSGSMASLEEEIVLPPIAIPPIPSKGSIVSNSDIVLGPGDIHYDSILMMGGTTLTIVGPARLVSDDFMMKSNSNLLLDATKGEIELYSSKDFVLESNSDVTTLSNSALDVTLFLAGDNMNAKPPDSLSLAANSEFIGAIYAPNAEFKLASNFNIFGSIMCGRLDLSSFGTIHFDEALLYDGYGASGELESKYWHRLPGL
jgi:hypothetical protein